MISMYFVNQTGRSAVENVYTSVRKVNREKIIQHELDKYNTKMANRGPKKPVGRKRDPSLVNLDLINEKNIENIIISNSEIV